MTTTAPPSPLRRSGSCCGVGWNNSGPLHNPLFPDTATGPVLNFECLIVEFFLFDSCQGWRQAATLLPPTSAGQDVLIQLRGPLLGGRAALAPPAPFPGPRPACCGAVKCGRRPAAAPRVAPAVTVTVETNTVGTNAVLPRNTPVLLQLHVAGGSQQLRIGCAETTDGVWQYSTVGDPDTCLGSAPTPSWLMLAGTNPLQTTLRVAYTLRCFSSNGRVLRALPTADASVFRLVWAYPAALAGYEVQLRFQYPSPCGPLAGPCVRTPVVGPFITAGPPPAPVVAP